MTGADFRGTTSRGFTKEQLYATASYQAKNLAGIGLGGNNLSGWDFSGQNLANAALWDSTLTNANLSGAVVTGADFRGTTSRGFTKEQLYATASYQAKNLAGIGLGSNDLSGWDFSGQNLANASLGYSTLTDADLSGAVVTGADFAYTTSRGFTKEQLYSTASYQAKNLAGIGLGGNNLTGWDFSGQNLANAILSSFNNVSTLTNADLSGAVVTGADFRGTTSHGFTKEQLYSTASYQAKNLAGIKLWNNDLSGWDFSGQNLANAYLQYSTLTNANLSGANLANAALWESTLTNANLSGADTRGAQISSGATGATSRNAILPDGNIAGLSLAAGVQLVVRDYDGDPRDWRLLEPIPVTVQDHMMMTNGGVLQMLFDADPWNSTISFVSGIPVTLGGTLELMFAADIDVASQVGRTLHVFDWTGVAPAGEFAVESPYAWDLSRLYTSGEVTLLAIPEPASAVLFLIGLLMIFSRRTAAVRIPPSRSRVRWYCVDWP